MREEGITLVSLVITVIVLIILAGVGVYAGVQSIREASSDKLESELGMVQHAVFQQYYSYTVSKDGKYIVGEPVNISEIDAIESEMGITMQKGEEIEDLPIGEKYYRLTPTLLESIGIEGSEDTYIVDYSTGEVLNETVKKTVTGIVLYLKGSSVQEASEVPIPNGYVASQVPGENTVGDGLVIYEGTAPVTESNHEEAMETRNQFVWIPVEDINSMVMCSSNSGSSVCNLVLEEDTLKCTTHEDTATDLVGRLYIGTAIEQSNGVYSYEMDFTKRDQTYDANSGYREPAVVIGNGTEYDGSGSNYHRTGSANNFFTQLKNDFKRMATSVAENEGFYISRYEIGKNGESKKEKTVLTSANNDNQEGNYLGTNMWYGLYNVCRDLNKNKQMIWGCQYDQVIKYIGEEAETGHDNRNLTTSRALSGQNELDKMKNIYDLEGNFREWTIEANSSIHRVIRGSYYGSPLGALGNSYYSASVRNITYPNNVSPSYSTRSIIYL